jgi:hypothetical protein
VLLVILVTVQFAHVGRNLWRMGKSPRQTRPPKWGAGNGNYAYIVGDGDQAHAGGGTFDLPGNHDTAEIFGNSDMATAGGIVADPGSADLASVLGDQLDAVATGGNFLVDMAP